jgi:methionine sulfoxide reductase catalytic subunit
MAFKSDIPSSEITPEALYHSRRDFIKAALVLGGGALLAACAPQGSSEPVAPPGDLDVSALTDELGGPLTPYDSVAGYNNFYEFTTTKERVAALAQDFRTSPWDVEVGGLVQNPKTYAVEDLLRRFPQEERIYRLRCVEGWSMVIPWNGFELSALLKEADPMTSARYVRFVTLMDPDQMPGQRRPTYPWPYTEGLRLDEAAHELTLLSTGLYGNLLPPQNGAPLRLVVPWKYGFKSIKSIVRIELVEDEPDTLWSDIAPHEYGFYANVNPEVAHPRWSQASERRIGESRRRETLLFNGYAEQVAQLYAGMDLRIHY